MKYKYFELFDEDINEDSENLDIYQPRCERSEGAQNASTEPQQNISNNLPSQK